MNRPQEPAAVTPLEVTQADREAAAEIAVALGQPWLSQHPLPEAFARHRIEAAGLSAEKGQGVLELIERVTANSVRLNTKSKGLDDDGIALRLVRSDDLRDMVERLAALSAPVTRKDEADYIREINEARRAGWRDAMEMARASGPPELIQRLQAMKPLIPSIYGPLIDQTCAALSTDIEHSPSGGEGGQS